MNMKDFHTGDYRSANNPLSLPILTPAPGNQQDKNDTVVFSWLMDVCLAFSAISQVLLLV